jgi:uncharacterized membrane protein
MAIKQSKPKVKSGASKNDWNMSPKNKKTEEGRACAALSYIIVGIIWFFVDEDLRKNEFTKFHVKNALVLFILAIILDVAVALLWFLRPVLGIVVNAFLLIIWIVAIVMAASGKERGLLFFGKFAKLFDF